MKKLIATLLTFASLSVFAQDGYHSFESTKCGSDESCLVNTKFDHVIKTIPVEDESGEVVGARLSSDSFLADTVYNGATVCFKGNAQDVCHMMDLMSNGDGGHATITKFKCNAGSEIQLSYEVDYDGYGKENLKFEIKKCE